MNQLFELFSTGGFMMYPLLAASIITVAVLIERVRLYASARTDMVLLRSHLTTLLTEGKYEEAASLCEKAGGITGSILSRTLMHRRLVKDPTAFMELEAQHAAASLKEKLNYLSAIVTLAPLMGLLGTVTGMIRAFDVLAISEGQPFAITGGVAEALIATAFGLLVAIIAMIAFVWLQHKANRLIEDIETGTGLLAVSLDR